MSAARGQAGTSLLELIFVAGILGILTGMAILFSPAWVAEAKSDGAREQVVAALRLARERAIADRRNFEVRFVGTDQIQIVRRDVAGNAEVGTTVVETVTLEGGMTFHLPPGVPDVPASADLVPGTDANGINVGGAAAQIFTSEGMLVDQTGDPLNVELFIARRNDAASSRAVTIFGPTALVRGYTWNGASWAH
jgi:Tfp pilus assembly protein FimT